MLASVYMSQELPNMQTAAVSDNQEDKKNMGTTPPKNQQ